MVKCLSSDCGMELKLVRTTRYDGFAYLGFFDIWTYECPSCRAQYQKRIILDEEAPTEHRILEGELLPRMFTDEELESSCDNMELYEKYMQRTGINPSYV